MCRSYTRLTNSPIADLNDFQDQLCLLLASLHENQRLQVQYFCDSDYKGELLRYQQETERFSNVWTKRARNERFTRYWQAMSERKLRRQRVIFYISRALENVPTKFQTAAARRDYYNTLHRFTYLHTDSTRNLCGTVHNVASPEMLYCSSSPAASTSTAAPANFARVRVSSKESSITPIAAKTAKPKPINTYENQTHHQRIQTAPRSPSSPACSPVAPPRAPSATSRSARAARISATNFPTAIRSPPPLARRAESS